MISVIVANYNKQDYVLETLESINNQRFHNWECIIVDDNSTDKSIEIINAFIKDKNRFSLVRKESNTGASSCRNIGLKHSYGDHIIFLDSDDILSQYCFKSRYNLINNTQLDFAVFPMGTFYSTVSDNDYVWNNFSGNHLKRFLSHDLPWAICSVIWKKSTLERLRGFDEYYVRLQDVELHSRALLLKNIQYQTFNEYDADCFYRINNDRIVDILNFIMNDINGKLFFLVQFNQILKNESLLKRNLRGTYFECYSQLFYYFKISEINNQEFTSILDYIKFNDKNILINKLGDYILNLYVFLGKNKIYFRGMRFVFKNLFLRLSHI